MKSGIFCLDLVLEEKFCLSSSMMLAMDFSYMAFIILKRFPSISFWVFLL